jgi:two-component system chemotaxis response regulator CheY
MAKTILVVDDSLYIRTLIKDYLSSTQYEVVGEAHDGETAIDLATKLKPDIVTLDNILPDMLGLDVLKTLKDELPDTKVLLISAVGQQSVISQGIKLGAEGYLVKPFTDEDLKDALKKMS